jgi:hypothetical protein
MIKKLEKMTREQLIGVVLMAHVPECIIDHHIIIEAFNNKMQVVEEIKKIHNRIDYCGKGPLPIMPNDLKRQYDELNGLLAVAESELERITDECIPMVR